MGRKNIIILVAADGESYQDLVQTVRETWGSSKQEGVEILYYYGYRTEPNPAPEQCIQCNDQLFCGVDPNDGHVRNRIAFNYLYKNYDFDYLFLCCAGSYLVPKKMIEFLQDKPKDNFYCGQILKVEDIQYASGAGFFLSKDLVKMLINDPAGFTCHFYVDVGFGDFFSEKGIMLVDAPRQDFQSVPIQNLDTNQYHYHIRHNIPAMLELHRKLVLDIFN
jgi:hypothetical protein